MEIDMTKDFRVEVKIKNNKLLEKIEAAGFTSVAQFAKAHNISLSRIYKLVSMKDTALGYGGKLRPLTLKLSKIFQCLPEDIFPEAQITQKLTNNRQFFTANESELVNLTASLRSVSVSPERALILSDAQDVVKSMVAELTPREQMVLDMRYGLTDGGEKTLDEIAKVMGFTRERIRQLEQNALRKMKHPAKSKQLREYYTELTTDPTE
jgi:RNA polymerase sigma factor (sigma-70 family)